MESNNSRPAQKNLTWYEEDSGRAVLLKNFNPDLILHNIEDQGPQPKDNQHIVKEKQAMKKISVDDIKEKQVINNKDYGEIYVNSIEEQEGMKALFMCFLWKNGQNEGEELILVRDQMEECYMVSTKEVTIQAKIHTALFSEVVQASLPTAAKLNELTNPIAYSINQDFLVFAGGKQLNPDQTLSDLGFNEGVHKILLIPKVKTAKIEGVRWWCPFTDFKPNDYIYESEHSLIFIPNDDIKIVGIGLFRIQSSSASHQKLHFYYKVYDNANSSKIQEGELKGAKLNYVDFPVDDSNKTLKFNFVQDYAKAGVAKKEPIAVLKGQHFHVKVTCFHDDYSNKFHYGINGSKYQTVPNMDMGMFELKDSNVFSGHTKVDKGCISGILYEF